MHIPPLDSLVCLSQEVETMKNTETYLSQFNPYLPSRKYSQSHLIQWITQAHISGEKQIPDSQHQEGNYTLIAKLFERYAVKDSQIQSRYLEISDADSMNLQESEIYKISPSHPRRIDIQEKTLFFSEKANQIFSQAYSQDISKPDHLIHVTCTGYISPSPAQRLVTQANWSKRTAITHAYHMGCYAALPAIRMAQGYVAQNSSSQSDYSVDIFHTEMCGLHMDNLNHTAEQMIVQTLFADGNIKYTADSKASSTGKSLKVLQILEKVLPESHQDMSWIPTPWGLQMNLSREVPAKIKQHLRSFFEELISSSKMSQEDSLKAEFAIHPGGPKIIDTVKEALGLSEDKVLHSRKILLERGNMSSATLPHVWHSMLQDEKIKAGTKIISFAFGPGLTIFGSVFEVCE